MNPKELYEANLGVIEAVIRFVCRRNYLSTDECDDFRGIVHLKLISHDHAVLRKFEGRSSLRTFLTQVLLHLYQDYRNALWGKYRPSAEALRIGEVAVRLEQLLVRDDLQFDEAVGLLRTNHGVKETPEELEAIRLQLPVRIRPKNVSVDTVVEAPSGALNPEEELIEKERLERLARAKAVLLGAIRALEARCRLIVKHHYFDRVSIAQIARLHRLEQKPLYNQLKRCLDRMKAYFQEHGVAGLDF